ncbi:glycoside hydrolase family 38 C-terminal domain-containing protein [Haloactinopolyspora sp.]|uniref:glycoside hydrolase family 38 N-terminal domain-containing protein n=1 Tax=Haloactinopolyspora sp. TaxID=1966353 RepID=UPI00261E0A06|nr:glycoside hydrolase family 38 C-terminal domain-containing protein [Haloactinopolyspora sp.]
MNDTQIVLVPHTHWDREWYEPFQVFRQRLTDVIDDVIARAEADAAFKFTLDGQYAAIDDYLEIRPENRDRVVELVRAGQLAIGPWHILLDEFLCSGETIVRNLEIGWKSATELGGAMPVGYLPDMFGHTAQMPQILARAGIRHAALWRGVPGRLDHHAFRWEAPDGSAVRVEYLFDGYGNALDLFAFPSRLGEAIRDYRDRTRDWYGDAPVLGMLGTDHSAPRSDLMELVRSDVEAGVEVASLAEYVDRFDPHDAELPTVAGELRSHARGNILPGVISVRVGLKQAMAQAERTVGEAEALAAQYSNDDFSQFFDLAWRKIVECTAHDSVTGCGVDETAEQVQARLNEAEHIGRAVRGRVLTDVASGVAGDAHIVVNTVPWRRVVQVELDVPAPDDDAPVVATVPDGTALPVQELGCSETLLGDETIEAGELDRVLRRIHGRELFGQQIESYELEPGRLDFRVAQVPNTPDFDLAALRDELEAAATSRPGPWRVRTIAQPRRRVLVTTPVDGSGQVAIRTAQQSREVEAPEPSALSGAVHVDGEGMHSDLVRVEVSMDGTLQVHGSDGTTLSGVGRLVSGGDRGDSYNYAPPAADRLVETPSTVDVTALEAGPLRGVLRVVREYDWPVSLSEDVDRRSAETVRVPVTTLVELRAGEPFVRLDVSFVNPARDHRLRLHVPLSAPVSESAADGQFAVTKRGLTSEGGWGEYPLPTFPASAFVSAGDATVLLDHVTEYELVDGGAELALTLLRSIGWMSVNVHPLRDEPAGSQFAVPEAQYLGRTVRTRLAVLAHRSGWAGADAVHWAEQFRHDPLVARGTDSRGADLPEPAAGLTVTGDGVVASSIRSRDGGVEVRLVAMSELPTTATVTGPFDVARRADLLGRPLGTLTVDSPEGETGRVEVSLKAWEIATIHVA